jgi:hypothetical protein
MFLFFLQNTPFDWDSENLASNLFRLGLDWDLVGFGIHLNLLVYFIFFAVFVLEGGFFIFAQVHLELSKTHACDLLKVLNLEINLALIVKKNVFSILQHLLHFLCFGFWIALLSVFLKVIEALL